MKGRETAEAYCEVLNHVASVVVSPTQPKKQYLAVLSKKVANSVSELVKQAETLKGILCTVQFSEQLLNPQEIIKNYYF